MRGATFRSAASFAVLTAIAALHMTYPSPLMDDVYITLRHALNFAEGHGLVYNRGEHLLAATSPLYAVFLSLFHPLDPGLVSAAVYCWPIFVAAAAFVAHHLIGGGPAGVAGALLLCTDPTLNPVIGMDTAFFVFWLLLAMWLVRERHARAAALLLGALPLARPDGVFLIAAVIGTWALESFRSVDRASVRRLLPVLGWFVLPLAVWCAIAIPYYGLPIPNSLIGKFYHGRIRWWWSDADTFRHQFLVLFAEWRYRALYLFSAAGVAVAIARADRVLRVAAAFSIFYLAAYSISHVPAYGNYFFPLFATITVLALRALVVVFARASVPAWRAGSRARAALSAAVAAVSIAVVWRQSTFAILSPPRADPSHPYVRIASFLKKYTPPDASVGTMEIGIVGYYSERRIVDFAGLASRGVARAVANGDLRFALSRYHPDFVIARYPVPGTLEGGLTEQDLAANYRWVFAAGSIGVFQPAAVDRKVTEAFPRGVDRDTVFILRQPVAGEAVAAVNAALADRNSVVARSWPHLDHDPRGRRFSYLSFKAGKPDRIEPVLEPSQVELFSRPLRLEFDSPADKLGAWNQVTVSDPAGSLIHLTTTGTDPYVVVPTSPFAPWFMKKLEIRMRVVPAGRCDGPSGGLLWITNLDRGWGTHGKAIHFPVGADGGWHVISIDLSDNPTWNGSGIITDLRYDPVYCRAEVDLDYLRIQ